MGTEINRLARATCMSMCGMLLLYLNSVQGIIRRLKKSFHCVVGIFAMSSLLGRCMVGG